MDNEQSQTLINIEDFESTPSKLVDLTIRRTESTKFLNNSGLVWFLIIIVLMLLAFSINIFNQPNDINNNLDLDNKVTPTVSASNFRQPRVYTVSYRNGVFSPTNLRIHAGDTVRFKNENIFPIRIVGDNLVGFDSVGDIPQGSFFVFTFATKGIFSYHNEKNPNETATIIVK
jgi:plastocyanin